MVNQTLDGSCNLKEDQLIRLVMKAYKRTALIPSRGVWGFNKHYASASGAMIKAYGEFPQVTNQDWLNGFDLGFEQGSDYAQQMDLLTYGNSNLFVKGFQMGHAVAIAVFDWPDAPDIDSKPEK